MMDIDPIEFANSMFGPEDETKSKCTRCGSVLYNVHFKDGLCHACQQEESGEEFNSIKIPFFKILLFLAAIGLLIALFS